MKLSLYLALKVRAGLGWICAGGLWLLEFRGVVFEVPFTLCTRFLQKLLRVVGTLFLKCLYAGGGLQHQG